NLTGFEVHSEVSNNYGRADAVWLHKGLTVIAELKYSTEATCETLLDEAMKQIHTRQYYNQHLGKILLLGIAFSSVPDGKHIDICCRMETIER
ncbi:MAG: PD-(D/E)XK nuclease domain-containing protein, partial [Bacteroidales bacterium]|nr:PD-(D/E)XK nuclease domain-containing protein [Bacteroidales bacterium]